MAALAGIVNVAVPTNAPVSNEMPATPPGTKAPDDAWLVTVCAIASRFRTVTTAPGATWRLVGLNAIPWIVIVGPEVAGGVGDGAGVGEGAGVPESDPPPPPQAASATAAASTANAGTRM
jgi:hypothetical protein